MRGGSRVSWTLLRKHSGLACSQHVAGKDKAEDSVGHLKLKIDGARRSCVPPSFVFCLLWFLCSATYLVSVSLSRSESEDN